MSSTASWGALQATITGDVILPEAPEFDLGYRALNARFDDVRPHAVVRCNNSADVVAAIQFAREHGMGVTTRNGGHCFGGRSSTEGLLVDVTPMHSVEISGDAVTVGGGTRLGQVYDTLLEQNLTIAAGSCPSVGVAGLALGGGLGIIGRRYGLCSDNLLGVQIVLADGRILESDEHHDEELFWALRGGGPGNFGVVTALTFRTFRAPDATNFHLTWPLSEAASLIDAWQSWGPPAPEELAASLVIGASANVDEQPSVGIFGVMLGSESDGAELVEQLVVRARSNPVSAFLEHMSFEGTAQYWADRAARERVEGEPPGQELRGCRFIKSEFFNRPLSVEVIEALLQNFLTGRVAGQSRELDFSPWGGGYNRLSAEATAFVHRDALFCLKHATEVEPAASSTEKEAAHAWVTRSWRVAHPSGSGHVFPNFPDPDLEDWAEAYYGMNLDRLLRVKARYDPGNLFRFQQSLPTSKRS